MRTQRRHSEADTYHVVTRGTGRQLIFEDDEDRQRFLGILSASMNREGVELYAWCLMGNHVHLLVHAPMARVSDCMKRTCGLYARYFNNKAGRTGHLFQERFRSEPINDDSYFLTVLRYIHANPAKAGISSTERYPWSSYGEYIGRPMLCNTSKALEILGGPVGFVNLHKIEETSPNCLEVDTIRSSTRAMPDSRAIEIASEALGPTALTDVKSLPKDERDKALLELKKVGLSIRQIERLTGIGRNTISRAR